MKAWKLKLAAMFWLRFGKRMPIVCTEVGAWNCDVLGVSPSTSVEVETKISKSDIRADFSRKTAKHFTYTNGQGAMTPNYLYFMVPQSLGDYALEVCQEKNPKIGILTMPDDAKPWLFGTTQVLRRAQKLHQNKPTNKLIHTAQLRCSSELFRLTELIGQLKDDDTSLSAKSAGTIQTILSTAVKASFRDCGHLDFEDPQDSAIVRAAELALAVDGVDWNSLDESQRERWIKAAERYATARGFEQWTDYHFL